jgi:hypothetical protein
VCGVVHADPDRWIGDAAAGVARPRLVLSPDHDWLVVTELGEDELDCPELEDPEPEDVVPLLVDPLPLEPVLVEPVLPLELDPDDVLDCVVAAAAVDFDSAGSLPVMRSVKISAQPARNTATLIPITHLRIVRVRRRRSASRCAAA